MKKSGKLKWLFENWIGDKKMLKAARLVTDCGAPLFVVEMPHANSVAMGVLVFAGTRDENWKYGEAGIAHACEHMVFRGNEKFSTSQEVAGFLEKVGGSINAWTNQEMTFYYNIVPAKHADKGVEYLHHLVSHPLYKQEDLEKEMKVIVEEIKRRNDDPQSLVMDLVEETAYGGHPLAQNTLGTVESVTAFKPGDFFRWHGALYYPENYAFLVVGNTNPEEALKLFNRHFSAFLKHDKPKNKRTPILHANAINRSVVIEKDVEQVNLALAASIGTATDRSTKALLLFRTMIAGGMSFPLFQEVREKRGLCYTVSAGVSSASDVGLFYFYVGTDAKRWQLSKDTIFEVLAANTKNLKLFEEAKELLLGKTAIKYESPSAILSKLAHDIALEGEPKLVQETLKEIESITIEEVTAAVEKYLQPERFIQACVAPKGFSI